MTKNKDTKQSPTERDEEMMEEKATAQNNTPQAKQRQYDRRVSFR